MKITAKLIAIGNSHGFIIPNAFIKAGMISKNETYELYISTNYERIQSDNDRMKRKLKEMNKLLIEKGIEPVLDEDFSSEEMEKSSGKRI